MSKVDEGKLLDGLITIAEYFKNVSDLSLQATGHLRPVRTYEG